MNLCCFFFEIIKRSLKNKLIMFHFYCLLGGGGKRLPFECNFKFCIPGHETNDHLGTTLNSATFNSLSKSNWPFGNNFQNFAFRSKRVNWVQFEPFGYNSNISYFAVKQGMATWLQLSNFVFHCKKTNGRLGSTVKDSYFAAKNEWSFIHYH